MWAAVALIAIYSSYASATLTAYIFNQTLDHFTTSDVRTFPQRYWVVDDFWDRTEGTPVMLFLGLAAPFTPSMAEFGIYGPALRNHKALGVGIENRYYGRSLNSDMLKFEYLKYLTFEQSLEDTKAIQDEVKKKYNIPDLKWISFGASYSGMKSIIHRLKMPDRIYAAFASSAPINFQYDMHGYFGRVGDIIFDQATGGSQACFSNVRTAFAAIDDKLSLGEFDELRKDFNLCPASVDIEDDREKFAIGYYLSGLLANVDQFSYTNPYTNPMVSICRPFTLPDVVPYEALRQLQRESWTDNKCTNVSYQVLLDGLLKGSDGISDWDEYDKDGGNRAWGFEICNNMGFNAYCDVGKGCPMSSYASQIGQVSMCLDVFNITEQQMRDNNAKFLKTYGGANPPTTRLLLTNGEVDCGYSYGITSSNENADIYSITTPYVGHVADINPTKSFEPVALYMTRAQVAQKLETWIEKATNSGSPSTSSLVPSSSISPTPSATGSSSISSIHLPSITVICTFLMYLVL